VKQETSASPKFDRPLDAVVVGAGFSGLYALYRLRDRLGLHVRVYEAGGGGGGTWYWNRYPGARCDVPSYSYSYSFSEELDQEWRWSEKCSPQPEIEQYLNHVTDRFDLRRDIRFNTRVMSATYDEASRVWTLGTQDSGTDEHRSVQARFFISAAGLLSRLPGRIGENIAHVPYFLLCNIHGYVILTLANTAITSFSRQITLHKNL